MNKKSTFVKWRRYLPLYLMLIPGVVYIFINNYIPMAGLIMAFEKYDYKLGMFKSPKIGLDNFTYLFATKDALNITRNTLLYNAVFKLTLILILFTSLFKSSIGVIATRDIVTLPRL